MNRGDIQVLGLEAVTCFLEDIGMDVPHGVTVTIPAAKAHTSKDLWRAISQKRLFHLQAGPGMTFPTVPRASEPVGLEAIREQTQSLVEENQRLRRALEAKDSEVQTKLDIILACLQAGVPLATALPGRTLPAVVAAAPTEVVSGEVPTFIPSQIKPENVDARIITKAEESVGAGVASAASALRKMRRGSQ